MPRRQMQLIALLLIWACTSGVPMSADEPAVVQAPVILTRETVPQTADEATTAAERLQLEIPEDQRSESVRMLLSIASGAQMQSTDGWFGPAKSEFTFGSLVERWGEPTEGGFSIEKLSDPQELLARLDRNKDGRITAGDLDWSDGNPWVEQSYMANRFFRRLDSQGDGQLTAEEWQAFFDKARGDEESLTYEGFRDALIGGGSAGGFRPGDAPSVETLLKGLASGEIGSLQEGPLPGDIAPEFQLPLLDGSGTVSLSSLVGEKPTVLVFGNYTCGPFRSMYPGVEPIVARFNDRVNFLFVYVREAHPCNGWCMSSNETAGVHVEQPLDNAARTAVAKTCMAILKPSIPVVVDGVDDTVGNQFSAMPARLYVLDKNGAVTYQSGRGPFGFKVGEMEQALVMTLLNEIPAPHMPETPMEPAEPAKPAE